MVILNEVTKGNIAGTGHCFREDTDREDWRSPLAPGSCEVVKVKESTEIAHPSAGPSAHNEAGRQRRKRALPEASGRTGRQGPQSKPPGLPGYAVFLLQKGLHWPTALSSCSLFLWFYATFRREAVL